MKFLRTGIEAADLERSIRFYHEGLARAVVGRGHVATMGAKTTTFHIPGSEQVLEFDLYPSSEHTPGGELDHLALEIKEAQTTVTRLVELAGRVVREVED